MVDHSSVEEMRRKHTEPISLGDCLDAFCSEETLDYSCEKCKQVQRASKKLQIWRLPPILVSIFYIFYGFYQMCKAMVKLRVLFLPSSLS